MGRNMTIAKDAREYTFGVEIETFAPVALVRAGRLVIGGYHNGVEIRPYSPEVPAGWTAERDSSLSTSRSTHTACEIVSPILRGEDGIRQVVAVCNWLNANDFRVNPSCGVHVHVGFDKNNSRALQNLIFQTATHEKALYASTGTLRRQRSRQEAGYSSPIASWKNYAEYLASHGGITIENSRHVNNGVRYHSLNLTNLQRTWNGKPAVEFRYQAGTTSAVKIVGTVYTAIALVQKAESTKKAPKWDAPETTQKSLAHRKSGAGLTALTRFFYGFGWTKGRSAVTFGFFAVECAPTLKEIKKEFSRLAKKYDKISQGSQSEAA